MVKSIEHIAIASADSAVLTHWYRETLGFEMVFVHEDTQTYFLGLPAGGMLEVLPSSGRECPNRPGGDTKPAG